MHRDQMSLFGGSPVLPEGMRYEEGLVDANAERRLVAAIAELPFREFEFQGHSGKRRVVSFGWRYDFNTRVLHRTEDMPFFLTGLREAAAAFAGLAPSELQHALVTEYRPGAGIGWHCDKAVFGDVIGISLLARCEFRLRRALDDGWERITLVAEPRSAYLLRGRSRTEWEHSIPPVDTLRYSVTFRNLVSK